MTMSSLLRLELFSASATASSSLRASAVSSAELKAKFTVRSNEPGVCMLGVAVTPRNLTSSNGLPHCGSRAQIICSTVSSSAGAGVGPSARLQKTRLQKSRHAPVRARRDGDTGSAATVASGDTGDVGIGSSWFSLRRRKRWGILLNSGRRHSAAMCPIGKAMEISPCEPREDLHHEREYGLVLVSLTDRRPATSVWVAPVALPAQGSRPRDVTPAQRLQQ